MVQTLEQELLAVPEVALVLGVSVRTVNRLNTQGKLPNPVRLGRAIRWRKAELMAWLEAGCPARNKWRHMAAK